MKSSQSELQANIRQHRLRALQNFYQAEDAYLNAGEGDLSSIAKTLDPDCVVRQPTSLPYGGEWRGHAGVETWMLELPADGRA